MKPALNTLIRLWTGRIKRREIERIRSQKARIECRLTPPLGGNDSIGGDTLMVMHSIRLINVDAPEAYYSGDPKPSGHDKILVRLPHSGIFPPAGEPILNFGFRESREQLRRSEEKDRRRLLSR